jgi:hypothetical protein
MDTSALFEKYWPIAVALVTVLAWAFGMGWRSRKLMSRIETLEKGFHIQNEDTVYVILAVYALVDGQRRAGQNGEVAKARDELQRHITSRKYGWRKQE